MNPSLGFEGVVMTVRPGGWNLAKIGVRDMG
jgi:hypothetical protein